MVVTPRSASNVVQQSALQAEQKQEILPAIFPIITITVTNSLTHDTPPRAA